jgi:hypothetical protein
MNKVYYHRSNPKYDVATQIQIANEYKQNAHKTLQVVADEFGCSPGLVSRFIKRHFPKVEEEI